MVTKYVCMVENCHFMTDEEEEAKEHMEMHDSDDQKIGIMMEEEGKLNCKMM